MPDFSDMPFSREQSLSDASTDGQMIELPHCAKASDNMDGLQHVDKFEVQRYVLLPLPFFVWLLILFVWLVVWTPFNMSCGRWYLCLLLYYLK